MQIQLVALLLSESARVWNYSNFRHEGT